MIGLIVFGIIGLYTLLIFGGLWLGVRHIPRVWVRMAVLLGFGVPLLALPLIDEIIGKYQFEKLCSQLEGVKYYDKVQLGPDFYFENGTPRWVIRNRGIEEGKRFDIFQEKLHAVIKIVMADIRINNLVIPITEHRTQYKEAANEQLLAEYKWYSTSGGWIGQKWGKPLLLPDSCGLGPRIYNEPIYDKITVRHFQ